MVHTKCILKKRGRPYTDFYINGKPQIYCMGWIDIMTDEPLQNEIDYREEQKRRERAEK